MSAGEPEETDAYQKIFDDLINSKTDYKVEVESVGDFEQQFQIHAEGGTLDVAAAPQPGAIPALVDKGSIVALEDLGFDIDELNDQLGESFVALGEYKGKHYGVPTNINLKSMVWYPKDDFDAAGYKVPTTWDELMALSDKIVADGSTPWCVGFGSEGSTGWPATDWMEDIMLRTAGPDVYDQWCEARDPVQRPGGEEGRRDVREVMFTDGYVLGGAADTPTSRSVTRRRRCSTTRRSAGCTGRRASSTPSSPRTPRPASTTTGSRSPPIDQEGTLYGGELTVVGKNGNRPEVVDFLKRFIAEDVQCEMGGVTASSRISPNVDVGEDCYANDILADASVILTDALKDGHGSLRRLGPDAGRGRPGHFWTGMVDYMKDGPDSLDGVLDDIEDSWPIVTRRRAHRPHDCARRPSAATSTDVRSAIAGRHRDGVRVLAVVAILLASSRRRSTSCGTATPTGSLIVGVALVVGVGGVFFAVLGDGPVRRLAAGALPRGGPAVRVRRARRCHPHVFLIYPVINTILISFKDAQRPASSSGSTTTVRVHRRQHAAVAAQHAGWIVLVPLVAVSVGLVFATLADRLRTRRGGRQVADLPADGDLVRRRGGDVPAHLQLPARGLRHQHRAAQRRSGRASATTRCRGCRSNRGTTCC